jgi:hypothetical protein
LLTGDIVFEVKIVQLFKNLGGKIKGSFYSSIIFPSVLRVTICQGIIFPLVSKAFWTALTNPPQQGTSILRIVILLIS